MPWIVPKHRCAVVLLIGVIVALAPAYWLWHALSHPDIRTKASRIRYHMTKMEVHDVVGSPPGFYRTKDGPCRVQCNQGPKYEDWYFDDGDIMVTYSGGFGAPYVSFEVFYRDGTDTWQRPPPPFLERLTSRFGF